MIESAARHCARATANYTAVQTSNCLARKARPILDGSASRANGSTSHIFFRLRPATASIARHSECSSLEAQRFVASSKHSSPTTPRPPTPPPTPPLPPSPPPTPRTPSIRSQHRQQGLLRGSILGARSVIPACVFQTSVMLATIPPSPARDHSSSWRRRDDEWYVTWRLSSRPRHIRFASHWNADRRSNHQNTDISRSTSNSIFSILTSVDTATTSRWTTRRTISFAKIKVATMRQRVKATSVNSARRSERIVRSS